MRSSTLPRLFFGLLFVATSATTVRAQGDPPLAADDPIQYPVTDASGTIVSQAVLPRREFEDRRAYLSAQIQFLDGGVKRFLITEDGAYQPLVTQTAFDQAVGEMRRMLNDQGLPPDARARIERRLRDQEDPAKQEAARRVLRDQFLNVASGAMDWSKVRGTLRGSFRMSCTMDGQTHPIEGNFQIVLMGDGTVAAAFSDARQMFLRADGRMDPFGAAEGSASGGTASIRWTGKFQRSGEQILLTQHTLQVTPSGSGNRCDTGTMALGGDVTQPVTTWFPEPVDWRAVRGQIGIDGLMDCSGASGALPRVYTRWLFQFVGDGTVRGTFQAMQGADFRIDALSGPTPLSGTIDNYRLTSGSPIEGGRAQGTMPFRDGEYEWFLALRRSQVDHNKIELHGGWSGFAMDLRYRPQGNFSCTASWFGQYDVPPR